MKINVTQEDIDNGKVRDSDCCPIALALKRDLKCNCAIFPRHSRQGELFITHPKAGVTIKTGLPGIANSFALAFDAGYKESQPFEFNLNVEGI